MQNLAFKIHYITNDLNNEVSGPFMIRYGITRNLPSIITAGDWVGFTLNGTYESLRQQIIFLGLTILMRRRDGDG